MRVLVYACGPGRLELTLIGKDGTPVEIAIEGAPTRRIEVPAGSVWTGSVPAPSYADGQHALHLRPAQRWPRRLDADGVRARLSARQVSVGGGTARFDGDLAENGLVTMCYEELSGAVVEELRCVGEAGLAKR